MASFLDWHARFRRTRTSVKDARCCCCEADAFHFATRSWLRWRRGNGLGWARWFSRVFDRRISVVHLLSRGNGVSLALTWNVLLRGRTMIGSVLVTAMILALSASSQKDGRTDHHDCDLLESHGDILSAKHSPECPAATGTLRMPIEFPSALEEFGCSAHRL